MISVIRCSPNPYEEGTESISEEAQMQEERKAAAQIPMKRELKVLCHLLPPLGLLRCSPNPYEEGTERLGL